MSSPLDDPVADDSVTPLPDEPVEDPAAPTPDEPVAGDTDQSSNEDALADDEMRPSLGFWSRISTKLYVGIGGAVALTLAASLVGWFSFNRVGDVQRRVNEGSVPELVAAFGVAQYGGVLANAAPSLAAAVTPMELFQQSQQIDQTVLEFEERMAVLEQSDSDDAGVARIRESADTLIANIAEIRREVSERFDIAEQRTVQQAELVNLRAQVSDVLVPALDDQLFYTLTGHSELDASPVPRSEHFSEDEVFRYRRLAELEADANITSDLLASAFALDDQTCWSRCGSASKRLPAGSTGTS